jgi:hypothetical protein
MLAFNRFGALSAKRTKVALSACEYFLVSVNSQILSKSLPPLIVQTLLKIRTLSFTKPRLPSLGLILR